MSAWTKTGSQLILRFLYDWDGQNLESEPNELSQILIHMEQVGPIVNKYASSVYIMQGSFVGNWGEMNNTTHMGNGEMETLIQKLDDVIDPSIFLSVRTPAVENHCRRVSWHQSTALSTAKSFVFLGFTSRFV